MKLLEVLTPFISLFILLVITYIGYEYINVLEDILTIIL